MFKVIATALCGTLLTISAPSLAQTTDLSYPGALEQVRLSNPNHYERLRQIVVGFAEKPSRVESDWLAQTFSATDVRVGRPSSVLRDLLAQSVQFKLDQSQYRLEVVRTDLNVAIEHPHQTLLR
jgi:hypothetical protein